VNKTGANLAPPVNLQLAAGQQQQRDVTQIFNLNPSDLIYGSLIIESSITGVVGDLSYSDPTGKLKFRAALAARSEPVKNFAFAHLDNRADTFTECGHLQPRRAGGARRSQSLASGWHGDRQGDRCRCCRSALLRLSGYPRRGFIRTTGRLFHARVRSTHRGGRRLRDIGRPDARRTPGAVIRSGDVHARGSDGAGGQLQSRPRAEAIVRPSAADWRRKWEVAATVPLPTTLAGTTVRVRDSAGVERLGPLFFVSAGQINYQLPPGRRPEPRR